MLPWYGYLGSIFAFFLICCFDISIFFHIFAAEANKDGLDKHHAPFVRGHERKDKTPIYRENLNDNIFVKSYFVMDNAVNNWKTGTIVNLPRQSSEAAKDGDNTFVNLVDSKYVCVRKAIDGVQRGILVKVLGKCSGENFLIKHGESFCKDGKAEGNKNKYYGFPIPTAHELKEVLDIVRRNYTLRADFKKAAMPLRLDSTFWVRETARKYLFKNKLQYYDVSKDECMIAGDDDAHWRLTFVYFYKSEIRW